VPEEIHLKMKEIIEIDFFNQAMLSKTTQTISHWLCPGVYLERQSMGTSAGLIL